MVANLTDEYAERHCLGALLMGDARPASIAYALATVRRDMFDDPVHRVVWDAIDAVHSSGGTVDDLTVFEELRRSETVASWDNEAWKQAHALEPFCPTAANLKHNAKILVDLWRQRTAGDILARQAAAVLDPTANVTSLVAQCQFALETLSEEETSADTSAAGPLADAVDSLGAEPEAEVKTGFAELDHVLGGGLQKGELSILAARPSMGKSALASDICRHAAYRQALRSLFVSIEMSVRMVTRRILSAESDVPLAKVRPGAASAEQIEHLSKVMRRLAPSDLHLLAPASPTIAEIRADAAHIATGRPIGLIVVDYLQLVKAERGKDINREREVAEVAAGLKALAKERDCPVLALAQLNRKVDESPGAIPKLSHLRESGAIEQDADVVMLLHRPGYYDKKALEQEAMVYVAKNRNGPVGRAELRWRPEFCRFEERY